MLPKQISENYMTCTMQIRFRSQGLFLITFIMIAATACTSSKNTLDHPTTSATLWVQNAAEYEALGKLVYQTATSNLALAIEDSYWTASVEQGEQYQSLPPAIILDVDETVLDNSPFQARMIEQNSRFNPEAWNEWVLEAKAEAVPGALEFTQLAAEKGVHIFYITNREAEVESGTRKNLEKLGFPMDEAKDVILSKNERENWTSAKTERRAFLAERYRILMLFGDDLNDFVSAKNMSEQERSKLVDEHRKKWGRSWYILPNPVYGSWEQALYNFNGDLSPEQIEALKEKKLNTGQQ